MSDTVLAVCLNGGPDKVYEVPGFGLAGVHRPSRVLSCVGGKGTNFARALVRLGHTARIVGFSAGGYGRWMEESLAGEGLAFRAVRVAGESRLATTIVDTAGGVHTEVNEEGPTVSEGDVRRMLAAFREELEGTRFCVIAGSAPPGAPDTIYHDMVATCHAAGVPVMLDTSRRWLVGAAGSAPDVLKPNRAELATLSGCDIGCVADAVRESRKLLDRGTGTVLVTLGDEGALSVAAEGAVRARLEGPVEVVSAVGSGDALAAGWVARLLEGADESERLAFAVACGTANAEVFGPCLITRERAEKLRLRVSIASP